MRSPKQYGVLALCAVGIQVVLACGTVSAQPANVPSAKSIDPAQRFLENQPIPFVPNLGQWRDTSVSYLAKINRDIQLAVNPQGWRLALSRPQAAVQIAVAGAESQASGALLQYRIVDDPVVSLQSGDELSLKHNYFVGEDQARWRAGVPTYAGVTLVTQNGVRLNLSERGQQLFYKLDAKPGAALENLRFEIDGAEAIQLSDDGGLSIRTAAGTVVQTPAEAWLELPDGTRKKIALQAIVNNSRTFSFSAGGAGGGVSGVGTVSQGTYGTTGAMVGTQISLYFSTLFGGGAIDEVHDAARSSAGSGGELLTLVGITQEPLPGFQNFPVTPGALQPQHHPNSTAAMLNNWPTTHPGGMPMDGFITQMLIPPTPSNFGLGVVTVASPPPPPTLVFSTFLGSNANDYLESVHVNAQGLITVGGYIEHNPFNWWSVPVNNYPLTADAVQTVLHNTFGYKPWLSAYREGILSQVDPQQTGAAQLAFSTYYGGTHGDDIRVVEGQAAGAITFAGYTSSADLPGVNNNNYAYDKLLGANGAAKLQQYGTAGTLALEYDAFVARIRPNTHVPFHSIGATSQHTPKKIDWATYLGGSHGSPYEGTFEMITDMVVEPHKITVVGRTDAQNYPVSANAMQPTLNQGFPVIHWDGFITELLLQPTAMQLGYSTYFGGWDFDIIEAMHIDQRTSRLYVMGNTTSSDIGPYISGYGYQRPGFPVTTRAFDTKLNNFGSTGAFTYGCAGAAHLDGFVSIINMAAPRPKLLYSTLYGGVDDELATSMSVNGFGQPTITGWSHSADLQTTANGEAPNFHGGGPVIFDICNIQSLGNAADVFVTRFDETLNELMYATFFGALQDEMARKVFTREDGSAIVTGYTYSNASGNLDYPGFVGASFPTAGQGASSQYTDAAQTRGWHTNYYLNPNNASYNLGEPFASHLNTETLGVQRYGSPHVVGTCNHAWALPVLNVLAVPTVANPLFGFAVINAPPNTQGVLQVNGQSVMLHSDAWGVARLPWSLLTTPSGQVLHALAQFPSVSCTANSWLESDALAVTVQ